MSNRTPQENKLIYKIDKCFNWDNTQSTIAKLTNNKHLIREMIEHPHFKEKFEPKYIPYKQELSFNGYTYNNYFNNLHEQNFEIFKHLEVMKAIKKEGLITQEQLTALANTKSKETGETLLTTSLKSLVAGFENGVSGQTVETYEKTINSLTDPNGDYKADVSTPNDRGQYPISLLKTKYVDASKQLPHITTQTNSTISFRSKHNISTSQTTNIVDDKKYKVNGIATQQSYQNSAYWIWKKDDLTLGGRHSIYFFETKSPSYILSETSDPLSIAKLYPKGQYINPVVETKYSKKLETKEGGTIYNLDEIEKENLKIYLPNINKTWGQEYSPNKLFSAMKKMWKADNIKPKNSHIKKQQER